MKTLICCSCLLLLSRVSYPQEIAKKDTIVQDENYYLKACSGGFSHTVDSTKVGVQRKINIYPGKKLESVVSRKRQKTASPKK